MTSRKIISCDLATDFLEYILHKESRPTILVVCSTRERFLEQLYFAIHAQISLRSADEAPQTPDDGDSPHEKSRATDSKAQHLLARSIGLLAKSSRTKVVFCPTLDNLRAYISVLHSIRAKEEMNFPGHQSKRPLLAILDLLALHRSTTEFSAQGLSRTLAAMVEVATSAGLDLVLCECNDALDHSDSDCGERLWHANVPILSGSIRMGGDEGIWNGRGVLVHRIAQRWFDFDDNGQTAEFTTGI